MPYPLVPPTDCSTTPQLVTVGDTLAARGQDVNRTAGPLLLNRRGTRMDRHPNYILAAHMSSGS